MKRTRILATLGPASSEPEIIRALVEAGVDCFRINASHGTQEDAGSRIASIRTVSAALGRQVGILYDLQGPKIRVGDLPRAGVRLEGNTIFQLREGGGIGDVGGVQAGPWDFFSGLKVGDPIYLNDGLIRLEATAVETGTLTTRVVTGGRLTSRKGVNLPTLRDPPRGLTDKDISDLAFALEREVDFIALSFVTSAEDLILARARIKNAGSDVPLIAKIEKPEAVERIDAILGTCEGIMVARGDLGVEMPIEQVPLVQKRLITKARDRARFVIVATQMLESMINAPIPTRAEVTDVANAVLDGADAVMLSAETATGHHPIETVATMARICTVTERSDRYRPSAIDISHTEGSIPDTITRSAVKVAEDMQAAAIIAFTISGNTAIRISRYRPLTRIIAVTTKETSQRRLSLVWGVETLLLSQATTTDTMIATVEASVLKHDLLKPADLTVITAGLPVGESGLTNMLKAHRIGSGRWEDHLDQTNLHHFERS